MQTIYNYIDGKLVASVSGRYLDNVNPALGEVYSQIPDSGEEDVAMAVAAAKAAFKGWSELPVEQRSNYLLRIADLIDRNHSALALAESIDNGKPLKLAQTVDIPRASANFRFYATAVLHLHEEAYYTSGHDGALNYVNRAPLGVAGCISPWNLPLYLFTWKIAPALAAGCTVVAKPSEITPMTAFKLAELCIEAGLPAGVLNIIHGTGPGAGGPIVTHKDVAAISFTGGTKTGEWIAREAAPRFKKLSLELGGKNPNIIFADCDFEQALKTSMQSSFANQGQICLCGSRLFIERPIYEKFRDALVEKARGLLIGDPLEEGTRIGAVVSKTHQEKVLSYIQLAKEEGGTILCGGEAVKPEGRCRNGYFIQPTVIEGLTPTCRTNQEEIFGPVITLTPFDTEEEAVDMANCTAYGLSATIWSQHLQRTHRVARALKSGIVWVNTWLLRDLRTPFGGMKQSGVGREGGFEALKFFTEEQNVCIKL